MEEIKEIERAETAENLEENDASGAKNQKENKAILEVSNSSETHAESEGNEPLDGTLELWQKRVESLMEKYPVSRNLTQEIGEFLEQNQHLLAKENCLETALLNVLALKTQPMKTENNEKKMIDFVKGYKAPPLITEGEFVTAPTFKAESIKEANKFASLYLKNKKNNK